MPKTIRELSEELGVSKTAITKFLTPEKRKLFANQIDNRLSISDEGVYVIRSHFSSKIKAKIDNQNDNQVVENKKLVVDFNNQLLTTLQAELAEKNKQIEKLQKNIDQQNVLLDQQQKLTLQVTQQLENYKEQIEFNDQQKNEKDTPQNSDTSEKKTKKHWWQF